MAKPSMIRAIVTFLSLIALVVILSMISGKLWGGKPESTPEITKLTVNSDMTIKNFGQVNNLSNPVLKEIFGLQAKTDLDKKLKEYGTPEQIMALVTKKLALAAEHRSKNWKKIVVKFILWFAFLSAVYFYFKYHRASTGSRKAVLFISMFIFGILLGADPSPMGTVKDAIHLYGSSGVIFPPRMIALFVFLLIVFLANKYICAWGCQAGTLQDLIFRLNQTNNLKAVIGKQIKIPFIISNGIRILFFAAFSIAAFTWGTDIVAPVDPFKIYTPAKLLIPGIVFIGGILITSLFVYRPWCHFFCPFGLVGWLLEKVSRVKISVNYETCIACEKCAAACPSTVMHAILKQDKKTVPDCFACYTCREVCPTGSISFSKRKRTSPPAGHFKKKYE